MMKLILAGEFPPVTESDWREQASATLPSGDLGKLVTKTLDGIDIAPIFATPKNQRAAPCPARQTHNTAWEIIQRADIPDITAANSQILDDLMNGATGISLVMPGAVNSATAGLPLSNSDAIKRVLNNVDLDLISLRLDSGPGGRQTGLDLLEVYRDRNIDLSRARLNLELDPVAGFALGGAMVGRSVLSARMAKVFNRAKDIGHSGNVFSANGRAYHEAGASEALELGLAIASSLEILRLLEGADISPQAALPQLGLMLAVDSDQFLSISKLRAARLVWQRLQEVFEVEALPLQLDCETSGRMMSQRDPYVNLLRTTTATFAAGVGGVTSLSVLPFSSAIGLPDAFARRMARNNQIVLQEESSIGMVGDAAAGSGYVEDLTGKLAEQAWEIMQEIEAAGGMIKALGGGLVQNKISACNKERNRNIARRKQGIVGVSEFANLEEAPVRVLDVNLPSDWKLKADDELSTDNTCEPLQIAHLAAGFQALRDAADEMADQPAVQIVTLGKQTDFAARTMWMRNLFAAGGIDASDQASKVACICSSDAIYDEQGADVARKLKADGVKFVFVAGRPGGLEEQLVDAGVDGFVFAGCDVLETLQTTLKILAE